MVTLHVGIRGGRKCHDDAACFNAGEAAYRGTMSSSMPCSGPRSGMWFGVTPHYCCCDGVHDRCIRADFRWNACWPFLVMRRCLMVPQPQLYSDLDAFFGDAVRATFHSASGIYCIMAGIKSVG